MSEFTIVDSGDSLLAARSSTHEVLAKKGFDTCARLLVERQDNEWYVSSVETKPNYRKKGLAKQLINYVEEKYGAVVIKSANNPFWESMGFQRCDDGLHRRNSQHRKTARYKGMRPLGLR